MARGRRPKAKDDGSEVPGEIPPEITTSDEIQAYRRLVESIGRVQSGRASDQHTVVIAAKRMARLQMLYKKLESIVGANQLIVGVTESTESTS